MYNITIIENCQSILYCLTYLSTYLHVANLCIDKKFSKIVKALGIFFIRREDTCSQRKERKTTLFQGGL